MNDLKKELDSIIDENGMYNWEETSLTFVAARLTKFNNYKIFIQSDKIISNTYWIIRYFRSKGIEPSYILSSESEKIKNPMVLNVPVITFHDLADEDFAAGILVEVNKEPDKPGNMGERIIRKLTGKRNHKQFPNFVFEVNGRLNFERKRGMDNYYYLVNNKEKFYGLLDALEDEISKKTLLEIIRSLIDNDIYRYKEYETDLKYFDGAVYTSLNSEEVWINCGSCSGDTILWYLEKHKEFKKIYAVETSQEWIAHLHKLFELLPKETREKICIYDRAFGDGSDSYNVDKVFQNEKVSLINMDIEGAELMVLDGAQAVIKENLPVLAVAAYHEPNHLTEIPRIIGSISDEYHFFLRKYRGYSPEAMNEYVYYAVPKSRMI